MNDRRATATAWIRTGCCLLGLALASACAPKGAHRQTAIMEKSGAVRASAAELRIRVNDLAERLSGQVEVTADRIRGETRDPVVRHRALVFKIEAVPAIYGAAYRTDPLVAAIDVWALAFQITQYLEEGAGRGAFGPQQPLAREAASIMLAHADQVMERIATGPEAFQRARVRLAAWVKEHPIQDTLSSRSSGAAFMAQLREQLDAFAAVGAVSDTMETISERLNTYATQLPKQARWQAELLVSEMAGQGSVEGALGDVRALGAAARRANELMDDLPGATEAGSSVRQIVDGERRALLEGVDRQRVQTLEYATAERLAVLAALRDERLATVAALHEERVETLREVDAIKTRAVDTFLAGLRDLVDYTLWRVGALLAGLITLAATLGVVGYWLTVGRRRGGDASA